MKAAGRLCGEEIGVGGAQFAVGDPANEEHTLALLAAAWAERQELPDLGHEARAKMAVAEHVLAVRERAASTAAHISPPDYIKRDLGERPSDPTKAGLGQCGAGYRGLRGQKPREGPFGHAAGSS